MSVYVIAVDFDGTLCEEKYPQIGEPKTGLINYLKDKQREGAKLVLWTCRVEGLLDDAVRWCRDRGLIFDAVNQNVPEIIEAFGGDTRKIFANEYIDDRNSYFSEHEYDNQVCIAVKHNPYEFVDILHETAENWRDEVNMGKGYSITPLLHETACVIANLLGSRIISDPKIEREKSNLEEWAEREIELACKRERGDNPEDIWDYGCACYESAYKAFQSLCADGHSGYSIGFTKQIPNRLTDCKPLTPIEDADDIWNEVANFNEDDPKHRVAEYQCKRMSGLFKTVYADGTVKYHDNDRFTMYEKNSDTYWHSSLVSKILEEKYPISMPYIPENKSYKAVCEEYLIDRKNGDFDTIAILYVEEPNGNVCEINRYFKDAPVGFDEIDEEEFKNRKAKHYERENKERKDGQQQD